MCVLVMSEYEKKTWAALRSDDCFACYIVTVYSVCCEDTSWTLRGLYVHCHTTLEQEGEEVLVCTVCVCVF